MDSSVTASPEPVPNARAAGLPAGYVLLAALLCCVVMQAWLVFTQPINWDEFRFLADVHQLERRELTWPIQTFHAHLFGWLLWLPGNEIDQIIAARVVMLALECGTAALIYRCARRFASTEASLLAAVCYLSFSYVMQHGASFRYDPPVTFLLMSALSLMTLAQLRIRTTMLIGALVAVAAMITIKSVFYVPTLAALAWWRMVGADDRSLAWRNLALGGAFGGVTLAALYGFHVASMAPGHAAAQDLIAATTSKAIGQSNIMPQAYLLRRSLLLSPLNWAILVGGIVVVARAIARPGVQDRSNLIAMASFALPLATLIFYRNAFPYYYAFMLAPVAVLAAPAAEAISKRWRLEVVGALLAAIGLVHGFLAISPVLATQRATVDAVHSIFREPVAYIDRCSMIGSSRKQGIFMSSWNTEVYRAEGKPIMRGILVSQRPAYVLVNSPMLEAALPRIGNDNRLLPEDAQVLRGNFIHHWGPVWVAGKRLVPGEGPTPFEVLIAGDYTLEAAEAVMIDGKPVAPGMVIRLDAGQHSLAASSREPVLLRWGDHLHRPRSAPPTGELFAPF